MIELTTRKLEVKFENVVYQMDYPTVAKSIEMDERFAKGDKKDNVIMVEYFIELGLPEAVVNRMEDYQFAIIMKELVKPK